MKKVIIMALCLLMLSLLMTSCAGNMSMPWNNGNNGDFPTDGWNGTNGGNGTDDQIMTPDAGEYHADANGRVRNNSSDNDFEF